MIIILEHPLVKKDISILRDKNTSMDSFRACARRIGVHLAVSAYNSLPNNETLVETPLEKTKGFTMASNVVLAPILRAGAVLVSPFLELLPEAAIGYIGLRRNEQTLNAEEYHYSMPKLDSNSDVIILDPMIATGGSISSAINRLEKENPRSITVVGIISAPEGIERIEKSHPNVKIITAALDRQLNEKGYILPGLGDAGDRFCGTLH